MSRSTHGHCVSNPLFLAVTIYRGSWHDRSVFLNTALLFWAFNIKADPKSPIDEWAFTESANTHPLKFDVIFESRAKNVDYLKDLLEGYAL